MKCPFCGSSLESNAKYCNDCGTALDSPESHRAHNVYKGNPPYVPQQRQTPIAQRRVVQQPQEPQYRQQTNTPQSISNAPYNRKPVKKKSGCGIVIFIIVILFFVFGMVNSIFGDDWMNKVDDFFNKLDSGEEITFFDSDNSFYMPYGSVIGDSYENSFANLRFNYPPGFEESGDSFDERELVGTYSNEFEIVKDNIFVQVILTKEYEDPVYCLQRYGTEMITALYDNHSFDELECDDSFEVKTVSFAGNEATSITFGYSVGGEKHIITMVSIPVDDCTLIVNVNSPSSDINDTVLGQFKEY